MWGGITGTGHKIGPFFLEGTLTGVGYLELLQEEIIPQMKQVLGEELFTKIYFQQDGASVHRKREVLSYLHDVFVARLITLSGGAEILIWPPCSPDLSAMDFYFWNAIITRVYYGHSPPSDLASLKSAIQRAWNEVDPDEIARAVTQGFQKRIELCLPNDGGYFERNSMKEGDVGYKKENTVRLTDLTYIHLKDTSGEILLKVGPQQVTLSEGQTLVTGPSPFIFIP